MAVDSAMLFQVAASAIRAAEAKERASQGKRAACLVLLEAAEAGADGNDLAAVTAALRQLRSLLEP